MATLWARRASYDSIAVGDDLPILVKHESKESIDQYARLAMPEPAAGWHSLHTDPEFASGSIFGGPVNMGTATTAYVAELLEKAFPLRNIMRAGTILEMRATRPIRPGDTITFTGRITSKGIEDGVGLVVCEVSGTNQDGETVAKASATIAFDP